MRISAEALREVRRHLDLTQAEMAEHLDVSPRTVFNWEATGVPESKVSRIHKILKGALNEVEQIELHSKQPWPTISDEEVEEYRQQAEDASWEPSWKPKNAVHPDIRLSRLLKPFSTADLAKEILNRAKALGEKLNTWDAERVERYQQFIAPRWEDPDYSDMSAQDARDYGLAAKQEDEHIGFDDLPNEP